MSLSSLSGGIPLSLTVFRIPQKHQKFCVLPLVSSINIACPLPLLSRSHWPLWFRLYHLDISFRCRQIETWFVHNRLRCFEFSLSGLDRCPDFTAISQFSMHRSKTVVLYWQVRAENWIIPTTATAQMHTTVDFKLYASFNVCRLANIVLAECFQRISSSICSALLLVS